MLEDVLAADAAEKRSKQSAQVDSVTSETAAVSSKSLSTPNIFIWTWIYIFADSFVTIHNLSTALFLLWLYIF